jgi:integrase
MSNALYDALAEHKMRCSARQSEFVFVSKTTGDPYGNRKHFVERLCTRAGVKKFGYHGIRGLSATVIAQVGIPLPKIQAILRHASMTTTERYVRSLGITSDRLSEAFDRKGAAPKVLPFRTANQTFCTQFCTCPKS